MNPTAQLIQAECHAPQIIRCNLIDRLLRRAAPQIAFFYARSAGQDVLLASLRKVLANFPLVAGTVRSIGRELCIDCNNNGVPVSVVRHDCTMEWALQNVFGAARELIVDGIDRKMALSEGCPGMTIRINYFTDGGMVLGICWHHTLGDMHTLMSFMKAWSKTSCGESYPAPLVVQNRAAYCADRIPDNGNTISSVRHMGSIEKGVHRPTPTADATDHQRLVFYFSESELANMKRALSGASGERLSMNDVLCAHMCSIVNAYYGAGQDRSRYMTVLVNSRQRLNLPDNLLGNFVHGLSVLCAPGQTSSDLAGELRRAVDELSCKHMNYHATVRYIAEHGGPAEIDNFVFCPGREGDYHSNLQIVNSSKFGAYDVKFDDVEPIFFLVGPSSPATGTWPSVIAEGWANRGLSFFVTLPAALAARLVQRDALQKMHEYRAHDDPPPEWALRLPWIA